MPIEAEWEYAARGGNKSRGYTYAGGNEPDAVAWYTKTTSDQGTKPVGTKAANELGLNDLSGNVREWCWDWWGVYTSGTQNDPAGADSGTYRVNRGGGWYGGAPLRSAVRNGSTPGQRSGDLGFRLVRGN